MKRIIMSPAVISDELMKEFHTSGTALGSLAAVYFLVYSAMQIPSGVLMEPTIGKNRRWLGNLVSVMKVRAVWPGFFANFGITGSIYAFMGLWGIPFLRDGYNLDRAEAAQYVTVMLVTFSFTHFRITRYDYKVE